MANGERVPGRDRAEVPTEKVLSYLLDLTHAEGTSKAEFLIGRGFSAEDPEALVQALLKHVTDHPVTLSTSTPWGVKYVVEGLLECPDGTNPNVRSVWFIGGDSDVPRLVTAYPVRPGQTPPRDRR